MPGSIHGIVMDRNGSVCEGAHITLTQSGSVPPSVRKTTSDNNGRFDFSGVPAGAFTITISSQGFAPQVITGLLRSGESHEAQPVSLLLATAASEVQVTASQQEIAQEQLKEEEVQRVFGIIPNFYVSYSPDAVHLTTRQKFQLAWKSTTDPVRFLGVGAVAGIEQADDIFNGYGQGAQGYAKRYGADYADQFIGTMIGSAMLASLLKQDPRYFYKGTGTKRSRVLYAIKMSVMCKGDNGNWQVNYSNILGSLAAGGISNLYYPAADRRGASLTFGTTGLGIAGSAVGNIFQEFIIRKLTFKFPHPGSSQP